MKTILWVGAMAPAFLPTAAPAQTRLPPCKDWYGSTAPCGAVALVDMFRYP